VHICDISFRQASVAQLVERSAVNRKVAGSIPAGSGFFYSFSFYLICDFNIVIYVI
jgi:hypothetical protein